MQWFSLLVLCFIVNQLNRAYPSSKYLRKLIWRTIEGQREQERAKERAIESSKEIMRASQGGQSVPERLCHIFDMAENCFAAKQ